MGRARGRVSAADSFLAVVGTRRGAPGARCRLATEDGRAFLSHLQARVARGDYAPALEQLAEHAAELERGRLLDELLDSVLTQLARAGKEQRTVEVRRLYSGAGLTPAQASTLFYEASASVVHLIPDADERLGDEYRVVYDEGQRLQALCGARLHGQRLQALVRARRGEFADPESSPYELTRCERCAQLDGDSAEARERPDYSWRSPREERELAAAADTALKAWLVQRAQLGELPDAEALPELAHQVYRKALCAFVEARLRAGGEDAYRTLIGPRLYDRFDVELRARDDIKAGRLHELLTPAVYAEAFEDVIESGRATTFSSPFFMALLRYAGQFPPPPPASWRERLRERLGH